MLKHTCWMPLHSTGPSGVLRRSSQHSKRTAAVLAVNLIPKSWTPSLRSPKTFGRRSQEINAKSRRSHPSCAGIAPCFALSSVYCLGGPCHSVGVWRCLVVEVLNDKSSASKVNRRVSPRYQFQVDIEIQWRSQRVWGRVKNISREGMFIELDDVPEPGARFFGNLSLNAPLRVIGLE